MFELLISLLLAVIVMTATLSLNQTWLKRQQASSLITRTAGLLHVSKRIAISTKSDTTIEFTQSNAVITGPYPLRLFNPIPIHTSRQNQTIGFKPSGRPKYAGSIELPPSKIVISPRTGRIRLDGLP